MRTGKARPAESALDAAEQMCPDLRESCARKRLAWIKDWALEKNYAAIVRGLDDMRFSNYSAAISTDAAAICLDVAQQASKTNSATAQRAVDKAFELDPRLAETEANLWLWLELHPEPSEDKLQRCKEFVNAFPNSEHVKKVQKTLHETEQSLAQHPIGAGPLPGVGRGVETLEEKLLRRKKHISTSTEVYDAVSNKEIWIIEVADSCTADQFDAEQTQLLLAWVNDGGVLWVNSNVLTLFGVRHSHFECGLTQLECEPAGGSHPILEKLQEGMAGELQRQ